MNASARPGQTLAVVVAIAALAWAWAFACQQEPATGRLIGTVLRKDNLKPVPNAEVYLHPDWDSSDYTDRRSRRTVTDQAGRFSINQVRAGSYMLSASTEAHSAESEKITVTEEGFTQALVLLKRSQPDLQVAQQRRVLTTHEEVGLRLRGYVDPYKPAHTDTFTVQLYRTRLSTVLTNPKAEHALRRIGPYEPLKELPRDLLKPAQGPPEMVLTRTERIVEDDREGFFDQRTKFGKLRPGLYLAQITCGKNKACQALQVTDLALVVKQARGEYLAFATDLSTGVPIAGVTVRSLRKQRAAATVVTNGEGLARWALPFAARRQSIGDEDEEQSAPSERTIVVATRGEDDAVSSREYTPEGSGAWAVHMLTDRPIYRPGQTIQLKGIARVRQGDGYTYSVPANRPVRVQMRDPSGELIAREGLTTNGMGSFAGHVDLSSEAPTGVYTIVATIEGQQHTHDVVVASYKKPEFTVTVTPIRDRVVRGETAEYAIKAEYYFGAPVAGAKVKYNTYSQNDWSSDEYESDDEEEGYNEQSSWRRERLYGSYYGEDYSEGEVTLDESGRAVVRVDTHKPKDEERPIDELLTLHATVTDSANRETDGEAECSVVQGGMRVGIDPTGYLASPGQPIDVVVSAAPYDGPPRAGARIELEYGTNKWVRRQSQYSDYSSYEFEYRKDGVLIGQTGADGKALISVIPKHSGEVRLTARVRDAAGRVIESRTELYCTAESTDDIETEYADLAIYTDRKRYAPGQTARILINALHAGPTALLTIEGDRILRTMTVPIKRRSTVVTLPVLAEYGPNVYVSVCAVRDRKFASSTQSLRVDLPASEINVGIVANRPPGTPLPRYGPGDPISYTVTTTDKAGKPAPCEFSFGVVDEAIYALREDTREAIRSTFYPRRQNRVDTDYSFALEMLGDADKAEPKITARKRFPDTAYWAPFAHTDATGHATVSFRLPDNLTTWRATAIACSSSTAVGFGVGKVIVSKDLLVRLSTPRTLTQGDRSTFVATVHNDTPTAQTALVRLRAEGLALTGGDTATLKVPAHGAATATFAVRADRPGDAKLRVTAWTPLEPGRRQLTDGIETSLSVLPDGHEVTEVVTGEVGSGKTEHETFRLDPSAIPGYSRLTVRIIPSIRSPLGSALEYVVGFPYGCTEQTLSRFVPLITARHLRQAGLTTVSLPQEDKVVRDGLARLYRFQREKGYWGWWEQDSEDAWMTAYALYGLATARSLGQPVSTQVLQRGCKGMRELLPKTTPEEKGFALYALALAGDKGTATAGRASIDLAKAPSETLAYAALLDKLTGADPRPAIDALMRRSVSNGALLHWPAIRNRWHWSEWSDVMTTAAAVRALVATDPADARIAPAVRWLMLQRQSEAWMSTRDTAWVVDAFAAVIERIPNLAEKPAGSVRVVLNGTPVQTVALTAESVREPELVVRVPAVLVRPGKNDVVLEKAGSGTVFYTVQLRQTVPGPTPAAASPPVKITREWYVLTPTRSLTGAVSLEPVKSKPDFHPGDRIRVKVILNVAREMPYVIIKEPFAAGCEVNERGSADEAVEWNYWWSGIDVRDDHIAFFAKQLSVGRHEIEYNLTAQAAGTYRAMPTSVQCMYDPVSAAEGPGQSVEVRR